MEMIELKTKKELKKYSKLFNNCLNSNRYIDKIKNKYSKIFVIDDKFVVEIINRENHLCILELKAKDNKEVSNRIKNKIQDWLEANRFELLDYNQWEQREEMILFEKFIERV